MGPIPLLILFVLFIIVNKITFVNHFAGFFGNIYFFTVYFLLFTVLYPYKRKGKLFLRKLITKKQLPLRLILNIFCKIRKKTVWNVVVRPVAKFAASVRLKVLVYPLMLKTFEKIYFKQFIFICGKKDHY